MNSSTLYTGIAVVLAIVVVVIFFFFPNYLHGITSKTASDTSQTTTPTDTGTSAPSAATAPTSATSLTVQDVQVGTGAEAKAGDQVVVQYVGKLADGTVFDASSAHTQVMPGCSKAGEFCFTLGAGQVIPGWDQGLVGMKVGGERTMVIPPSLAYGSQGVGPIPANATLMFDVKLVGINPPQNPNTLYAPTGPAAN